ncbi:MAG TPA: LacI family DNA-binding transcriptional regulator [Sphingomonas sp.]|jgi:LacI family transcriptional regulator|nr:LacI family DNA-binding transcriptional regulator [Sphingomonas sp.]
MAAATIRDVARQAGVSVASVSRALNGHTNVHPDTRALVAAAAKALGYVPHAGARSLSMARSHAIGVVLPDLHGEFFSEIVRGMDREAHARGYQLLLSNMHADIELAGHAMRAMRGRVDGLVVMAPQVDPVLLGETLPRDVPTVLIHSPDGTGHHSMRADSRRGADTMVRHLVDAGCKHIVHLAGPVDNIDGRDRRAGFEAAMASVAPAQPATVVQGDFTEEAGERAVAMLLAEGSPVDAIFAANDMMALGALYALRQAGVAVPGRIAVAGFDDVPMARHLTLTTMRVRMADLGARAIARLVAELDGSATSPAAELVDPELVVRGTTRAR